MVLFESFLSVLLQALLAAVSAYAVGAVRAWWINLLGTRVEKAVGRAAGEILANLRANPHLSEASEAMIEGAVEKLFERVGGAISSLSVTNLTLRGMLVGELGKAGAAVKPRLA